MDNTKFEELVTVITEKVIQTLAIENRLPKIHFLGNKTTELTVSERTRIAEKSGKQTQEIYLITEFSLNNLVNSANLSAQTAIEKELVELVQQGKSIVVVKEGRLYQAAMKTALYGFQQKIKQYEQQLEGYGVRFLAAKEWLDAPVNKAKSKQQYLTAKELIEKNVAPHQTIVLPSTLKLTDAAKEYLQEKKIQVKRDS